MIKTHKTFTLCSLIVIIMFSFLTISSSYAEPLVVTMDKTNLTMDWSAMNAPSYTLYYALADYKGDIDINTLGSIEMGSTTSIYVPGLPSGLIIYSAILAHAPGGDVVSNVVKFMGFGGTVSFPGTGAVLMQVDDASGIGTLSVSGTRNADGSVASISQISGDDGSGLFVMQITDDKPSSYKKGDSTTTFIYNADGSVRLHTQAYLVESSYHVATYSSNDGIDCSLSRDEYGATLHGREFLRSAKEKGFPSDLFDSLVILTMRVAQTNNAYARVLETKIGAYMELLTMALDGIKDEMLDDYDQQCNGPDTGPVITKNCPIPEGAVLFESTTLKYYKLNNKEVGPEWRWSESSNGELYLRQESCRNAAGIKNGWFIEYYETGIMHYAIYNNNGQNEHEYDFYPNGSVWYEKIRSGGEFVSTARYNEDGTLARFCDTSGCENY